MTAALLQELIDAGTPVSLVMKVAGELGRLAGAAEALERLAPTETRSKAAVRQARYRHNKASQNVTDRNEMTVVTENVTPPPSLDKEIPPRPPKEINPNPVCDTRTRGKPIFALPSHIPADEWGGYVEMRRTIRKPMTDRAKHLAVMALDKLAADGWPPGDVLNHCTLNSYQGIFPPKGHANGNRPANDRIEISNPITRAGIAREAARRAGENPEREGSSPLWS